MMVQSPLIMDMLCTMEMMVYLLTLKGTEKTHTHIH